MTYVARRNEQDYADEGKRPMCVCVCVCVCSFQGGGEMKQIKDN